MRAVDGLNPIIARLLKRGHHFVPHVRRELLASIECCHTDAQVSAMASGTNYMSLMYPDSDNDVYKARTAQC